MISYLETRLLQSPRGFNNVCHCMIAMDSFVHIIVEGLDTYLDSGDAHREHVIHVVFLRPVWPSFDRDCGLFSGVGARDAYLRASRAIRALSVRTTVGLGHHCQGGYAADAAHLFVS